MDQLIQTLIAHKNHNGNSNRSNDLASQICHQLLSTATKLHAVNHLLTEIKRESKPIPDEILQVTSTLVKELQSLGNNILQIDKPNNFSSTSSLVKFDIVSLVEESIQPYLIQAPERKFTRDYGAILMVCGNPEKTQII
ncbi:MAG: hypothetical protein KDJ52_18815, partial [Anaerolineae bacterium]|nr:hypothetical protein [Anaerolineae bacterium]